MTTFSSYIGENFVKISASGDAAKMGFLFRAFWSGTPKRKIKTDFARSEDAEILTTFRSYIEENFIKISIRGEAAKMGLRAFCLGYPIFRSFYQRCT